MVCYRVSQEKNKKGSTIYFHLCRITFFVTWIQLSNLISGVQTCRHVKLLLSFHHMYTTGASAVDLIPPQTLEKLNMSYLNFLCLLGTKPNLYKTFQTSEFLSINQTFGLHVKYVILPYSTSIPHFLFLYACIIPFRLRFILVCGILNLTEY